MRTERDEVVEAVREFVEREVLPVASRLEHADEYPEELVESMRELGLFGATIAAERGGLGLDLVTYARITMELSRGWMTLAGVLNSHLVAAWMIEAFGTDEQRSRLLPAMSTGRPRAAMALTEPHAGSDLRAIRTRAERDADEYVVSGEKVWITNGLRAGVVMLLARTEPEGISVLVLEKEAGRARLPGLVIAPLAKLGYKSIESVSLAFDGYRTPASSLLGSRPGEGLAQFLAGMELGRVNVAARGVGLATAAFESAIRYAQEREAFGKPISEHQAIQLKLAQMATKIEAARLLTLRAAERKDAGERADLEAGMAKYFASETAAEVALDAMRVLGGYGYSPEFVVERLYRDAPLLIVGEGTNEVQQLVIARRLLERHRL
jgi:alkylation response protein AidB-like acyl-CoA dehydrogenase